jgi:hypothetical protein
VKGKEACHFNVRLFDCGAESLLQDFDVPFSLSRALLLAVLSRDVCRCPNKDSSTALLPPTFLYLQTKLSFASDITSCPFEWHPHTLDTKRHSGTTTYFFLDVQVAGREVPRDANADIIPLPLSRRCGTSHRWWYSSVRASDPKIAVPKNGQTSDCRGQLTALSHIGIYIQNHHVTSCSLLVRRSVMIDITLTGRDRFEVIFAKKNRGYRCG